MKFEVMEFLLTTHFKIHNCLKTPASRKLANRDIPPSTCTIYTWPSPAVLQQSWCMLCHSSAPLLRIAWKWFRERLENERTFPRNALHSIPFFLLFLLQFWLQCTAFRDNGYDYDYFLRAKVSMRKRRPGGEWDIISKSRWSFRKRTILARCST